MKLSIVITALIVLFMAALGSVYVSAFLVEPNWPEVDKVAVGCPRLLPCLGGLRILHLSDLHVRWIGFKEEELIRKVSLLDPDVILISGDIVGRPESLDDSIEVVKRLKARIWKYGVYGEDEGARFTGKYLDRWKDAGLTILADRAIMVDWKRGGHPFCLVGVDTGKNTYNLDKILKDIPADVPKLMLAHSPTGVKPGALAGVDLVLAGDTHGGQIGIPQLYRFSGYAHTTAYREGLFKVRGTFLYVNRGLGWSLRPTRFLCRPEIALLTFCGEDGGDIPAVLPGDEL